MKGLLTTDTFSVSQSHGTTALGLQRQKGIEVLVCKDQLPPGIPLSWTHPTCPNPGDNPQNLLTLWWSFCCSRTVKKRKEKKTTYSSFPASLDAYFVYHRATLNPMETSSNTASCWALKKDKTPPKNLMHSVLVSHLSLLIVHIAKVNISLHKTFLI